MARILLIDEEAEVRLFHRVLLEELDGYEVIDVGSGAAAKAVMAHQDIDAVVLDFQACDIDGPQFMDELRMRQPRLPIIINTGNDRFCDYFTGLGTEIIAFKSSGFPDLENALNHAAANKSRLPH
jgi:DNA-binding NtrC family response regulator